MSPEAPTSLEDVVRDSGEGWLIEGHASPSEAMDHVRRSLAAARAVAVERGMGDWIALDEPSLVAEYKKNPLKLKSLFQAVAAALTPEMLLMTWRVLQGMEYKELSVSYNGNAWSFKMRVVLELDEVGDFVDECYESSSVADFRLLRHIGFFQINSWPFLEGFYPLSVAPPARTGM